MTPPPLGRQAIWRFTARVRREIARPLGTRTGRVAFAVLVALAVAYPWLSGSGYNVDVFTDMALWGVVGLGLNVVIGFAGLLDLGYMAFYAFGGYAFAILSLHAGVNLWEALPIGAVVAGLFAALFGFPTLRLRGDYLAIMTLGFGGIVDITARNLQITGSSNGLYGMPTPTIFGHPFASGSDFYVLALLLLAVAAVVTHTLRHSKIGRAWTYVKEDELAAQAVGIGTARVKLMAYMVGATWAGFAGAIFAAKQALISPESFTFNQSFYAVAVVVMGGMGSVPGVIVGAVIYVVIAELYQGVTGSFSGLIFSIALLAITLLRPEGLWPYRPRRPALPTEQGRVAVDDFHLPQRGGASG